MEEADGNSIARRKTVVLTILFGAVWAMPLVNAFVGIGAIFWALITISRARNMLAQIGKLFGLMILFVPLCWLGALPYVIEFVRTNGNVSHSAFENFSYLLAAVGGITFSCLVTWSGLLPFDFD